MHFVSWIFLKNQKRKKERKKKKETLKKLVFFLVKEFLGSTKRC